MFSSLSFVNAVKNPLSKIKASLKQFITTQKIELIPIIPQKLYHISTPTQGNIQSLLQQFKTANQFQLWNISQYSYGQEILAKLLDGRQRNSDGRQIVFNLTYEFFASIPFCEMIKSIQTIQAFISLNPKNKVYIHCQENKRRSAIFLASYIFLTGVQSDIVTSILKVNKLLNISMQEKQASQTSPGSIYKSQHIVLKNLMNYINNSSFINKNAWNLKKVLINNAPKIHDVLRSFYTTSNQSQKIIKFKVLLQIRSVEGISYKKIFHDEFIQGQSLCLRIPQIQHIVLKDDFVLIIKYVHDKKGYSILRAQLNTNFIYDQFCRVQRNDMDLSVNNAHSKNDTIFMDLLLENNPNQQSELSKLNILKENQQHQASLMTSEQKKEKQNNQKTQISKQQQKQQDEDEEDGFGILDQEQEAVHNQKMQRQIEEQLAKELQKIRKKKNQQQQKPVVVEQKVQENKDSKNQQKHQATVNIIKQNVDEQKQTVQQAPKDQQKQQEQSHQQNENLQNPAQNTQAKSQNNQQQDHSQEQSASDQEEESSSEQDQQDQQQEEDLDDYLSKLQKQAQKHD